MARVAVSDDLHKRLKAVAALRGEKLGALIEAVLMAALADMRDATTLTSRLVGAGRRGPRSRKS